MAKKEVFEVEVAEAQRYAMLVRCQRLETPKQKRRDVIERNEGEP
jgi:hypothetical protein